MSGLSDEGDFEAFKSEVIRLKDNLYKWKPFNRAKIRYRELPNEKISLGDGSERMCKIFQHPSGVNIQIPISVYLNPDYHLDVDLISAALDKFPGNIFNHTRTITLNDFLNPDDAHWKKFYKDFTQSYATGGTGAVDFYKSNINKTSAAFAIVEKLAHECGHNLDKMETLTIRRTIGLSDSQVWKNAVASDLEATGEKSVSDYAKNSLSEDFADSVAFYIVKPKFLASKFPARYHVLKRILAR